MISRRLRNDKLIDIIHLLKDKYFDNRFAFLYNTFAINENDSEYGFAIVSCFYRYPLYPFDNINKNVITIYITGESYEPDMDKVDYAISSCLINNDRHFRFPLYPMEMWAFDYRSESLIKQDNENNPPKTKFCNFIYSNPHCEFRNRFFELLSRYKRVDSAGAVYNNVPRLVSSWDQYFRAKVEFQKQYKFSIAFENKSQNGYLTEKIVQPMMARSLPIYWGDPLVYKDFNPKSFVNYYDYNDPQKLVDRIIEIDNNDELYQSYCREPYLYNNKLNKYLDKKYIIDIFKHIFYHGTKK